MKSETLFIPETKYTLVIGETLHIEVANDLSLWRRLGLMALGIRVIKHKESN